MTDILLMVAIMCAPAVCFAWWGYVHGGKP
jgi:hypothetical protein